MLMPVKRLVVLIDFVGHPILNQDYLNERRIDCLLNLVRDEFWSLGRVVVNVSPEPLSKGYSYDRYKEKFLEIENMAIRNGITWINIEDEFTTVQDIVDQALERGFGVYPASTQIVIGGTNLGGCVFDNKNSSAVEFEKYGFYKVKMLLPLCAEAEGPGLNDLEKTWFALSMIHKKIKDQNLNIDIIHHENFLN